MLGSFETGQFHQVRLQSQRENCAEKMHQRAPDVLWRNVTQWEKEVAARIMAELANEEGC